MKDTGRPALSRLSAYTRSTFQTSGRRHLLLTGSKGIGKTTLCEALVHGAPLPGVRSYLQRDGDGLPLRVVLEERTGPGRLVIARRTDRGMTPDPAALDTAAGFLRAARLTPGTWAVVDEVGFLEGASPRYQAELEALFREKRVLAVLRKADTPLLARLRARPDCLLLDLDELSPD